MSKKFPKGWKPRKPRKPRIPVPPPGFAHQTDADYKRSRDKCVKREVVDDAVEELEENQ